MSKHSLLPSHATPGAVFAVDTVRLRNGYLTSDVVGLAIRYWRSYPSYLVVCNSLSEDQKNLARSRLDSAYDAATWVLMREASKIGFDPYALQECGRLVKRLYREDPKRAYYSQKDCYYWPDCIDERQDEWPSELPESEQAVLRNGEAVFTRLVLHWESAKAAPTESPLALKRDRHTQPNPAGITTPALLEQGEAAPPTPTLRRTTTKTKRNAEPDGAELKLIAALTKHHRYNDDSELNYEPIRCRQLAKLAGVWPSTASDFFKDKFRGYKNYCTQCRDPAQLAASLRLLNGEFAPHHLFSPHVADPDDKGDDDR